MSDLVSRLLEAIEAKEEKALRVKADWHQVGETGVIVASDGGRNPEECANGNWAGIAEFMVDNDPSSVLRRCEADRRLLKLWADPFGYWTADQAKAAAQMKDAMLLELARGYGITEEEK